MGIFDIFNTSDQTKAAQDQNNGIQTGLNQLTQQFGLGKQDLKDQFGNALKPLQNNYDQANAGVQQLMKLLGIGGGSSGGAGGGNPVMDALKNMPGYQATLDTGDQNILRNQAATGNLNSGATNVDLQQFGQGTAQNYYGQMVSQLMPFLGQESGAASGIAGVDTGLGTALNANDMGLGNAEYGANTSMGNNNANADLAGLTASGNIMGALMGLLKMGTGSANSTVGGSLASSAGAGLGSLGTQLMAMMGSDEKIKDDIEPVGELYDGQQVYRYRYKGDPRHQLGLIAQEVEKREPAAVAEIRPGIKGVHYKHATERAAHMAKFLDLKEAA